MNIKKLIHTLIVVLKIKKNYINSMCIQFNKHDKKKKNHNNIHIYGNCQHIQIYTKR